MSAADTGGIGSVSSLVEDATKEEFLFMLLPLLIPTLVYGFLMVLFLASTWLLCRRGPTTRATVFMLVVTVMMFCISTCAWVLRLVRARVVIRTNIVDAIKDIALAYPSIQDPLTNELDKLSSVSYFWDPVNPIWSHLGLGNFILNDVIAVWRAWVVSAASQRARKWILVTSGATFMLELSLLIYTAVLPPSGGPTVYFNGISDTLVYFLRELARCVSLFTNAWTTLVIGRKAWQHRTLLKSVRHPLLRSTPAMRVLVVLVESGGIYCVIWSVYIASWTEQLTNRARAEGVLSLFAIYPELMIHLAAIYPTVIIILVSLKITFGEVISANYANSELSAIVFDPTNELGRPGPSNRAGSSGAVGDTLYPSSSSQDSDTSPGASHLTYSGDFSRNGSLEGEKIDMPLDSTIDVGNSRLDSGKESLC
ncbi:uncharacterized protein STEHIDRAFT_116195 [Stereum hirsutum FP-91666 SS1]|uniref:Uncharacterized protein n=1 Tax=Stereum hirsutum (strain FP-91666) TaxID=721885 RepID=R7S0B3_STEHR|nr:uncharacterized protein STEHIDRAFT_116195 [Stereum hirsutum FP-91666 SS1]EIM80007.1 hypothetical protein STEHIDRAFT_116195 [Stereum hirsutum FP-91666 SS1]